MLLIHECHNFDQLQSDFSNGIIIQIVHFAFASYLVVVFKACIELSNLPSQQRDVKLMTAWWDDNIIYAKHISVDMFFSTKRLLLGINKPFDPPYRIFPLYLRIWKQ